MKWTRERDLLIAQTMAFVQSVSGHKPEAENFARADVHEGAPTRLPDIEAMLAEGLSPAEVKQAPPSAAPLFQAPAAPAPVAPARVVSEHAQPLPARPATRSEYRSEIQARVDKFRAHQATINREREAYCSATLAKVQATLNQYPVPRPSK